jgi:hypothetical protein
MVGEQPWNPVIRPLPYLCEPFLKFSKPAFRAVRLINFETGKADLQQPEHDGWLVNATHSIPQFRKFEIWIFSYASKRGFRGQDDEHSDASNVALSYRRGTRVAQLMESIDPEINSHIVHFTAEGNKAYTARNTDNSGLWRAVEVHIFLDEPPPRPFPPAPEPPPCPGGRRFKRWSIAMTGVSGSLAGAQIAVNIVAFRVDGTNLAHVYLQPAVGGGFSWSGGKLKEIWEWIEKILGRSFDLATADWSEPFTADNAFNFKDLDGATFSVMSVGAGIGPGVEIVKASIHDKLWIREASGKCFPKSVDWFSSVEVNGKGLQGIGITGSIVGGPLLRVR